MPERISLNQRVQIGAEVTPGTNVSAGKLLESLSFVFSPKPVVVSYRGTGRRYSSTAEENQEWVEIAVSGPVDYQEFTYIVSGAWGAPTNTTHAGGTLSKDNKWTPAVTGAITPQTYTLEQGDSVRAHKVNYAFIPTFGYKAARTEFTCTAIMLAQALQDGITMTSSPTALSMVPAVGKQVNLYLDTTSGGIGTTQLTRAFMMEYAHNGGYGMFWPLNRSNTSFTGHADLAPKDTVKLLVEADSAGMGNLTHLQNGDFLYVRLDAQGGIIESTIHYEIIHDIALKLINTSQFQDKEGIYAIEFEGEVMEDSGWNSGQAQTMTHTNLITTL